MATPPWEQRAAAEADFSLEVALPPRVTVLFAGRQVHPDPENRDANPYVIAATRHCLLAHFSAYPFDGAQFYNNPFDSHLVVVRDLGAAPGGRVAASVVHIPDRSGHAPILWNIQNVALAADAAGNYRIVELQADKGSDRATLVYLRSDNFPEGWCGKHVAYPLAAHDREWIPRGAAHADDRLWWFDLTWGILSYGASGSFTEPGLGFHPLPEGRGLDQEPPHIHTKRCVAASGNRLRYVEIIVAEGEAARVSLWTRSRTPDGAGWQWDANYSVGFPEIWDDDSYKETGLPRDVPSLVVVCPSDPNLVYFALGRHMFGVNVPARRVVHHGDIEPLNATLPSPVSGAFLVPWVLPPEVAQALPPPQPAAADPVPDEDVLMAAEDLIRMKYDTSGSGSQSQAEGGGC
ncbi:uncharacterized protein LOC120701952 [Panicum virgatum]|uniref:uncharacterized protein LOC120701952 n=1 Tax=Panicum virgatum TaxID=38727 RepID=UPI0019D66492|nr:uncharacterized protein LOC120701952 [Panicum virgatum]